MQANSYSKYALKDLHHSIALIDRRIACCGNKQEPDHAAGRELTLEKLCHKRAALVKAAQLLSNLGVAYDAGFLAQARLRMAEPARKSRIALEPVAGEIALIREKP